GNRGDEILLSNRLPSPPVVHRHAFLNFLRCGIMRPMQSIGELLKEKNIELDTKDPVVRGGFTQIPNFILKDPSLSVGAKVAYAMFLSYAWHNESCFPGQQKLAADMGMSRVRVTQLIGELQRAGLVTIQ